MSSKIIDNVTGAFTSDPQATKSGITSIVVAGSALSINVECITEDGTPVPVMGPDLLPVTLTSPGLYTFDSAKATLRLDMTAGTNVTAWIK